MKNKSIILNTIIILTNVGIAFTSIFYGFFGSTINNTVAGLLGALLGFQLSILLRYLGMTKSDFESTHINKEKAMKTWKLIIMIFSILAFAIQLLYIYQVIENIKIFTSYFLIWMIVTGNFRATIDPLLETLTVYTEDDDVKRKTLRFSGKLTFFSGIIGMALIFFLPQNLSIYVAGFLFFISTILPEFYAKHIFKQKYA